MELNEIIKELRKLLEEKENAHEEDKKVLNWYRKKWTLNMWAEEQFDRK